MKSSDGIVNDNKAASEGGIIKKTVLFVGYQCNNRCRFCMEFEKRSLPGRSFEEIIFEISSAKRRGTDYLEIIGGEATIRPDIVDIISFAKNQGFGTIMMATNGRAFAYKSLAEKILTAGLNSLVFSIHGPSAEIHDYLTQTPGSFDQLVEGIKNVISIVAEKKLSLHLGSNTCIVKHNYKYLPEIGELIRSFGIDNSEFIFVDPNEGGAANDFLSLVPKISEAAPYMRELLDIGKRDKCSHWHARYVPLCYFPNHLDQISEIFENQVFHTEHIAQDFKNFNAQEGRRNVGRLKTEKCRNCRFFDKCEGIWRGYIGRYGDSELTPVI